MSSDDKLSKAERLRLQNELTKSDLEDRLGAQFGFGEDPAGDFTPEMEAEFLKRIMQVEGGGKETYVPIRTFLSNKVEKKAAALARSGNFDEAVVVLILAFQQNGILTDPPDWITTKGFYHFLVGDFLDHTIPKPPPQVAYNDDPDRRHMIGVMYEQVRQDSPHDMAFVTEAFLIDLLTPNEPFAGDMLAHTCRAGTEVEPKASAIARINAWKEQWSNINPIGFAPMYPVQAEDKALYFHFQCKYSTTDKDGKSETFEGQGLAQLALENKTFRVVGFVMEGFTM